MSVNEVMFLSLCALFAFGSAAKTEAKVAEHSGPYVNTLIEVRKCEKPSVPYSKQPCAAVYIESYKNILKGNYTSLKLEANVIVQVQEFYYRNGNLKPYFTLKNINCNNSFMNSLGRLIRVTMVNNSCAVSRGAYSFEVDYNVCDHIFMPYSRDYGRMLRRVQARNRSGTFLCIEFESEVKPKN